MLDISGALGYRVVHVDDLGGPRGAVVGRLIFVDARLTHQCQQLTIAHEIGHTLLDPIPPSPERTTAIEEACDRLAVSLLMPLAVVARALIRGACPLQVLDKFDLSGQPLAAIRVGMVALTIGR